jgi:hypothetical protein
LSLYERPSISERLAAARRGEGPTLFDEIVAVIEIHGPDGAEAEDGIGLDLR